MGKYIRVFIVIIAVLGFVIVARSNAAWAASVADQADQSILAKDEESLSQGRDDDCDKNKNKDKDKKKCDDDDGGTVKPPKDDIDVCKRGDYSVGGVATLQVKKVDDDDCLRARSQSSTTLIGSPSAGTVLSDALVLQMPSGSAKVKICFAVPPGTQVKIYSAQGSWSALKTKIKNGIACTDVSGSGTFTLVGQ